VRPLCLGLLLDAEQTAFAQKRLVEALDHLWLEDLGTGFLSTPLILDVPGSCDMDLSAAFRLLENEAAARLALHAEAGARRPCGSPGKGTVRPGRHRLAQPTTRKVPWCAWLFRVHVRHTSLKAPRHFTHRAASGVSHFTHAWAILCGSLSGTVEIRLEDRRQAPIWSFEISRCLPMSTAMAIVLPDGTRTELRAGTGTYELACPLPKDMKESS
jgi:hypothetical protein